MPFDLIPLFHLWLRLFVHSVHESIRRYCPFAMRKNNNNMKETMTKNRQFSLCLPHNQLFILLRVQMSPNTSYILLHCLVCNRCIYISILIRIFSRCFRSICTLCEENGPCWFYYLLTIQTILPCSYVFSYCKWIDYTKRLYPVRHN